MAYPLSQDAMTVSDSSLKGRVPTLGASLSLRARVARSLRASITAGELKPGPRLLRAHACVDLRHLGHSGP
jgi:hypothetical protein